MKYLTEWMKFKKQKVESRNKRKHHIKNTYKYSISINIK